MTPAERLLLRGLGTPAERFAALCQVVTPERVAMLRALPYEAFLRTAFWRIITAHLKSERGECARCHSRHGLQVHHKSYSNHGLEHENLDDLEVLCRYCHATEHGLAPSRDGWVPIGDLVPVALNRIRRPA